MDALYQDSVNRIIVPLYDRDDNELSASLFPRAQYIIADKLGRIRLSLETGEGISNIDDRFVIQVDGDALASIQGFFTHQFVVWNVANEKLPPTFQQSIEVKRTITNDS